MIRAVKRTVRIFTARALHDGHTRRRTVRNTKCTQFVDGTGGGGGVFCLNLNVFHCVILNNVEGYYVTGGCLS